MKQKLREAEESKALFKQRWKKLLGSSETPCRSKASSLASNTVVQ